MFGYYSVLMDPWMPIQVTPAANSTGGLLAHMIRGSLQAVSVPWIRNLGLSIDSTPSSLLCLHITVPLGDLGLQLIIIISLFCLRTAPMH